MKSVTFPLFAIVLLVGMTTVNAAEAEQSDDSGATFDEKLAACGACHLEHGTKSLLPEYPILAGQFKGYLANSLRQYRDGQRTNEIMALQVKILELTDKDIDALATYFSEQKSNLHGLAE